MVRPGRRLRKRIRHWDANGSGWVFQPMSGCYWRHHAVPRCRITKSLRPSRFGVAPCRHFDPVGLVIGQHPRSGIAVVFPPSCRPFLRDNRGAAFWPFRMNGAPEFPGTACVHMFMPLHVLKRMERDFHGLDPSKKSAVSKPNWFFRVHRSEPVRRRKVPMPGPSGDLKCGGSIGRTARDA